MTLFLALLLDWFIGDPKSLWKHLPHPVVLIGKGVDLLDQKFNQSTLSAEEARGRGAIALLVLVVAALVGGNVLEKALGFFGPIGWLLEIVLVSIFIAQKSLADHVGDVAHALRTSGIDGGRQAVAQIVGRNPDHLDGPGIIRAAIESLSENFSDGVVAPVFWYAVLGLPGIIAYKAVNTADSMIGHKSQQYLHFGRATALFDDWINWPAARISALLIALASIVGGGVSHGFGVLASAMRDAGTHRSPNAGWPEAAMAASLGIALGGPRTYGNESVREPQLNASGKADLTVKDVDRALVVFGYSCLILWILILILSRLIGLPVFYS